MTSETTLQCGVCGDTTDDERMISECMSCSRIFHLNPYSDSEHKDCGDAMIGPSQGVEFWCQPCIEAMNAQLAANPPDPRAMIDSLAVPPELLQQIRPRATNQPGVSATDSRSGAPPLRRSRTRAAKRYRRVDD